MGHLPRQHSGFNVQIHLSSASMKSQFKKADKSGARYALILGADELQNDQVSVKLLRGELGDDKQLILKRTDVLSWLREQHGAYVC